MVMRNYDQIPSNEHFMVAVVAIFDVVDKGGQCGFIFPQHQGLQENCNHNLEPWLTVLMEGNFIVWSHYICWIAVAVALNLDDVVEIVVI